MEREGQEGLWDSRCISCLDIDGVLFHNNVFINELDQTTGQVWERPLSPIPVQGEANRDHLTRKKSLNTGIRLVKPKPEMRSPVLWQQLLHKW